MAVHFEMVYMRYGSLCDVCLWHHNDCLQCNNHCSRWVPKVKGQDDRDHLQWSSGQESPSQVQVSFALHHCSSSVVFASLPITLLFMFSYYHYHHCHSENKRKDQSLDRNCSPCSFHPSVSVFVRKLFLVFFPSFFSVSFSACLPQVPLLW